MQVNIRLRAYMTDAVIKTPQSFAILLESGTSF